MAYKVIGKPRNRGVGIEGSPEQPAFQSNLSSKPASRP